MPRITYESKRFASETLDRATWDEDELRQSEGQRMLSGCSDLWSEVSGWIGEQMDKTPDEEDDDDDDEEEETDG